MKKTLSILLSLLMVLSTVTCLFTMPVSAEETTTPAVETLPVNDFITNPGDQTLKPDSAWKINDTLYQGAIRYGIKGWNAKYETDADGNLVLDDAGNKILISGQPDSYIDSQIVHQMTFDVTVSEDVNEGVKIFPGFFSQATPQAMHAVVGIRSEKATPNKVETAYNYCAPVSSGTIGTPNTTADKAATLEAGKTYTYTYVFNANSIYVNFIAIFADSLTAGEVKISDLKVFPLSETDAGNFWLQKGAIPYAVEQDGNVFTRMYGYRDIGDTAMKKYVVSAKFGGELYNIMLKGGNTYELTFDARYLSDLGFHDSDSLGRSPAFDFFETGAIDYTAEYEAIKAAANTTETDTYTKYFKEGSQVNGQRGFSGPNNGYSYCYAGSTSETVIRRATANNIGNMEYYNADGTLIASKNQGKGSQHGRTFKNEINTGTWIKGVYTLNAVGAQTIEEAAQNFKSANMRYSYSNGAWTFDSTKKNIYASAEQDVTVALGIEFLYGGAVYDFDNFALKTKGATVPVEYKNANGETDTLANTAHTASTYTDALTNKTYATINLFESDTVIFDGWYDGDQFLSAEANLEITGTYNNLKAVFTSKNILTYAGGFENYAANTNLETDYTFINTENYPNYTGASNDNRRFYNALPTGDKWTGWDANVRLDKHITDSDEGATKAQIVADIEAAGGVINNNGFFGFTHFKEFPTVVKGTQSVRIYGDAGSAYGATYVPVIPYSGNNMLRLQTSSRTGFRAIEGLTAGKTYTLSFYAYNPYEYYYLKEVFVNDAPMGASHVSGVNQLGRYDTPTETVTEEVRDKDGNVTGTLENINKARPEYVKNWYKIEVTFTANAETAYLGIYNMNKGYTGGYTFIDELTLVEYDCKGNHIYDDLLDTNCNVCGEARTYPAAWDFEDGSMENITVNGNSQIKVVDAKDQAEKIGSKYLEYTSAGFDGMAINFNYEQGYKYKISYDFKIFKYGTGPVSNGIDHTMAKYDDGKYGTTTVDGYLAPYNENIVTRYYEDGTVLDKVTCFTHETGNNFYGRQKKDGVYIDAMSTTFGDVNIWNEWQHFEIEVGNAGDYEGFVEFGIRPNDAGWVVGVDNFKVEKIANATIEEANNATEGTYAFNIRARTADKKQGLRFKSTIDLDALNLADGAKIVEYGTLAYKAEYAAQGYFLRREAATDKIAKGKVVAGVAYSSEDGIDVRYALDESTNTLTYTGVLTGIGVKNYDVDFMVCGYAIVETANGERITVYDDAVTLSVYDAAQQIVAESKDANDVAVAQTVIDTYNAYLAAQPE